MDNRGSFDVQRSLSVSNTARTFKSASGVLDVGAGRVVTINNGTTELGSGTLGGSGGTVDLAGTHILNLLSDVTLLAAGPALGLSGAATVNGPGALINQGTLTVNAGTFNAVLDNQVTGTVNVSGASSFGTASNSGAFTVSGANSSFGTLSNSGTFTVSRAGGANNSTIGTLSANSGTLNVFAANGGNATLTVANGFTNAGTIELRGVSDECCSGAAANATLAVTSGSLVNATTGTVRAAVAGSSNNTHNFLDAAVDNRGSFDVQRNLSVSKAGAAHVNSGTIDIASGRTLDFSGLSFENQPAGLIRGTGTLTVSAAPFTNNGTLQPAGAGSVGTLSIAGNATLGATSIVEIEINGTGGGQFDKLAVSGNINFVAGNTMNVVKLAGYAPAVSDNFANIVTYGSRSGTNTFTNINNGFGATFTPTYTGTNLSLQISALSGTTNTWNFDGSDSWLNTARWSAGHVPTTSEDVIIPDYTTLFTVSIPSGAQVAKSIVVQGNDIFAVNGGSFTFTNASTINNGALNVAGGTLTANGSLTTKTLNLSSGLLNGTGVVTVNNVMNWSGGTVSTGGAGSTNIAGGATLNVTGAGAMTVSAGNFNTAGTTAWAGTGNLLLNNAATFNNNGTFDFQSDAGMQYTAGGAPTFTNTGTLAKSAGSGTTTIGISNAFNFINNGTLNAQVGTVNYASNNVFNSGTVFTGAGSNVVTGNSTFSGTLTSSSNLVLQGGNFSGSSAELVGTIGWSGGTMSSGTFTVPGGATLNLNLTGAGANVISAATFANAGTLNLGGTSNLLLNNGAQLNNSGMLNVQGDIGFQYTAGGVPAFNNSGTLMKSAGTTSVIGITNPISFVNSGTLNAVVGTINYAANNTFNSGTMFTGAGTNLVTTGSTFSGTVTSSSNLTLQSGNFSGTANLAGTTTWTGGAMTGALTIPSGATLIGSGAGNKSVDGGSVTNAGTVNWTGVGNLLLNNAVTFTNNAAFNLQSDAGIQYTSGSQPTFNNTGTLTKSAGATSVIGISNPISFVNSGTLNAAAGTINYASANAFNSGTQFTGAGSNLVTTGSTFSGTVTSSSNLTLQSGNFSGTANLAGTTTWTGGAMTGALTIPSGATLIGSGAGNKSVDGGSVTNAGTVNWTGAGNLLLNNAVTFTNNAAFNLQSDAGIQYTSGLQPTFNNTGTLTKSAGATSVIGISNPISFVNSGTLNAAVGTINYASANAFNGGTQFTGAGSNLVTTSSTFSGTVTSNSNLTLQSGNFNGVANLTGTTAWTGGSIVGTITVPLGATLNLTGSGAKAVDGAPASLTNSGVMNLAGAGNLVLNNSAQLANNGTLNLQSDAGFQYTSGVAPTFSNTGTLAKSAGSGTSAIGITNAFAFSNSGSGVIDVQIGTIQVNGGFATNSGRINTAAGTTFSTNGNALTNAGVISGSGTLNLGAATLSNDGAIKPGGSGAVGTLNITGGVILNPASIVEIELNGTGGGNYDQLAVAGNINFAAGSTMNAVKLAGYTPTVNDNFANVVTYGSRSGTNTFTNINLSFAGTFAPTYTGANLSLLFSSLNATNTWTGAVDSDWTKAGNWSLGHVPTPAEDVVLRLAPTVTVSGAQAVHALTSTEPLNILGGASLDLGAASTFGASLTLAGTLQGAGAATFTSGMLDWSGGTLKGGGLFTASGGTLTLGGSLLDGRTFNNSVDATLSGGSLTLANGAIFNHNAGTFTIADNSGLAQGAGAAGQFNNAGIFSKSGGAGTSSITGIQFANSGTVNANSGTLDVAVNGTHAGLFNVTGGNTLRFSAGATLSAASTVSGAGSVDIPGGTVSVNGAYSPATTNVNGGTLNFNAVATTIGTLNLSFGTVGGTGDLKVSTDFNKTGGSFTGSGNLDLTSAGDFTVGVFSNPGRTVTLRASAGAILDGNGSGVNNVTAGTLTLSAANGIALDATVANLGATNTTAGDIALANSGALNLIGIAQSGGGNVNMINTGALAFTGAATVSGGNLNVTASGAITQGAAALTGNTLSAKTRNDAGAAITLNSAANDFAAVDLRARNAADSANAAGAITYRDATGFDVASLGTTGTVNLTANAGGGSGGITQSGAITAPGSTVLQAGGGNINLALLNDFGSVGIISAGNATLNDINNIGLNDGKVTNTLTVTAPDTLTINGALTGNSVVLTSSAGNINGAGVITAPTITLNAVNGIGAAGAPVKVQPGSSAGLAATNTAANDIVLSQPNGNLLLGAGGATLTNNAAAGGYAIGAGGGNIAFGSNFTSAGNLTLDAAGAVNISDAIVSAAGALDVTAASLGVTATATFTQMRAGTTFTAAITGMTTLQGGTSSGAAAEIMNGGPGVFSLATGGLTIKGGPIAGSGAYARLYGNPDVKVTVNAGTINLFGNVSGGASSTEYAAIQGVLPTTLYANFPKLTAGGFAVNGIIGAVYDVPTASGFIAAGAPAILATNLLVTYSGVAVGPTVVPPSVQQQINQVVQQTAQLTAFAPTTPLLPAPETPATTTTAQTAIDSSPTGTATTDSAAEGGNTSSGTAKSSSKPTQAAAASKPAPTDKKAKPPICR